MHKISNTVTFASSFFIGGAKKDKLSFSGLQHNIKLFILGWSVDANVLLSVL